MPKAVRHVVKRPGRKLGDPDVEIPVAEDLTTVPGIPLREVDLSFYSREFPLESQTITKSGDNEWMMAVMEEEPRKNIEEHIRSVGPDVDAAEVSGDLEPTGTAEPGRDVTEDIRRKAKELGFGEVGFTRYDRRYVFAHRKSHAKFPHAICLALEQDYEATQTIPSMEAEYEHFGLYEIEGALMLELADYIRSLGYHAQVHHPSEDDSAVSIPMFVNAGLGQLGANGQLLSPHFGSRARLALMTTDALVTYDQPADYGIHKFCQKCQVCVDRCPGRALTRDKVWWRGAEKNKLIYERCLPFQARYEGCGVCMKVCPIQRYGMKPVMEHYVATGEVLGKGTDNLEGFTLDDKGYFGPGELPHFDHEFFEIPNGRQEEWLFEQFKQKLNEDGVPSGDELAEFAAKVKKTLGGSDKTLTRRIILGSE